MGRSCGWKCAAPAPPGRREGGSRRGRCPALARPARGKRVLLMPVPIDRGLTRRERTRPRRCGSSAGTASSSAVSGVTASHGDGSDDVLPKPGRLSSSAQTRIGLGCHVRPRDGSRSGATLTRAAQQSGHSGRSASSPIAFNAVRWRTSEFVVPSRRGSGGTMPTCVLRDAEAGHHPAETPAASAGASLKADSRGPAVGCASAASGGADGWRRAPSPSRARSDPGPYRATAGRHGGDSLLVRLICRIGKVDVPMRHG
jgi:hypothetical protein